MKKRMHFRPSHRDKAERHIITALRSVGASVFQVNGKDLPDLLVGFRGITTAGEVKSRLLSEEKDRAPRIRATRVSEGQKEFAKAWRGAPIGLWYEPADALASIDAPAAVDDVLGYRWLAENGSYLCEQCWLPENGLHAKDCPTRLALKRPPKVETAHRAAKKARDLLPKKHQDRLNEAGVVDLRDNMRLEHLGGGYARAVPIDPTKRHGDTPDWMAEAVREHHEELRKSRGEPQPPKKECGGVGDATGCYPGCRHSPNRPRGVEGELQPLKVKT